jgi:hypothetical protein
MSFLPLVENSHDFERFYGVYLRSTRPPKWVQRLTSLEQLIYFYPSVSDDEAEYWFKVGYAKFCIEERIQSLWITDDSMANEVPPNKEFEMFCMEGLRHAGYIWFEFCGKYKPEPKPSPYEQRGGLYDVVVSDHEIEQTKKWKDIHHMYNDRCEIIYDFIWYEYRLYYN